jgi:ADP-heptose:LPS heptosyltransferase
MGDIINALPKSHTWVNMVHNTPHEAIKGIPLNGDWLHTANVMSTLDLLVTVDTGVAHLAGAMGIPTWVILPGAAAWQYPLGHDIHPFYPFMRIFRNEDEGLDNAVQQVVEALETL